MRSLLTSFFILVLALAVVVIAIPAELAERQSIVKIMALGDSITGSPVRSLFRASIMDH